MEKEGLKQKVKGPTKRISYDHGDPKPLRKKIEKFLSHPISRGGAKRAEKKEPDGVLFALKQKESGWGLRLSFPCCGKQG